MTSSPKISIVATSRNDNHGGSLNRRMQIFVTALIEQCKRHKLHVELILVEWNPPADRVSLAEELKWPDDLGPCEVRIITVPKELHDTFQCSESLPLYQMIAKNVGIRRARGHFVLATNIDLLFSDELCAFLATAKLQTNKMYRIDRHDVESDVPLDESLEKQLAYCKNHLIRINAREGTFPLNAYELRDIDDQDVVTADTGIFFQSGWFGTECSGPGGAPIRWAESESELVVKGATQGRTLQLELGPGPGVNYQDFELRVIIEGERSDQSFRVGKRQFISIQVPGTQSDLQKIEMTVNGGGLQGPGWTRVLNFCVHLGEWVETPRESNVRPRLKHRVTDVLRRVYHKIKKADVEGTLYPRLLHTNACGDFTMLSKDGWMKILGYPELEIYSMHIDSLGVYEAFHAGIEEVILEDPMRVYHIEHGAGWTPDGETKLFDGLTKRGIGYLTYQDYLAYVAKMRANGAPLLFNKEKSDSWGLGDHELTETHIKVGPSIDA
jgi:hypothetical protein